MTKYVNPITTVDAALFDPDGNVLLGVRKNNPHKGKYNLPGGFLEVGETLEEGLLRELNEELQLGPIRLQYSNSRSEAFILDGKVSHRISLVFIGHTPHKMFYGNDEVLLYEWKQPVEIYQGDMTTPLEYKAIFQAWNMR